MILGVATAVIGMAFVFSFAAYKGIGPSVSAETIKTDPQCNENCVTGCEGFIADCINQCNSYTSRGSLSAEDFANNVFGRIKQNEYSSCNSYCTTASNVDWEKFKTCSGYCDDFCG